MNFKELFEGATPKLPGAVNGVKVMSPQQFVASHSDEEVDEADLSRRGFLRGLGAAALGAAGMDAMAGVNDPGFTRKVRDQHNAMKEKNPRYAKEHADLKLMFARGMSGESAEINKRWTEKTAQLLQKYGVTVKEEVDEAYSMADVQRDAQANARKTIDKITAPKERPSFMSQVGKKIIGGVTGGVKGAYKGFTKPVDEATALPAQQRELGGQEFQDYMTRIKGTDDLDKEGNVKVDKKGIPKYTTGKTKTDKYKMPYIHRSSAIEYYDEAGKRFKEEAVIEALKQRPKKLLKQNEKMKHSNGALEQFFNVGFAALTGVAVDETTGKLIIVNTCPGAGSCKVDCFAMKGGKVQFKAAWLSDGRILTYLLNDPTGFFNQLSSEIAKEEQLGKKGGYSVTIRWHDAGDFFSPEYLDLALKMAQKHPDVKFYAYTKMAGAALGKKPANFIINWSEGAHTSQEKQVKAADPNLDSTKNSRIVPDELFQDLLIKNEKGNLIKGSSGQWQVQPDKLKELKNRLAQQYGLSPSSILSYDEYTSKPKVSGMKYNVIVAPGEGDISANDPNVISTLLLRH